MAIQTVPLLPLQSRTMVGAFMNSPRIAYPNSRPHFDRDIVAVSMAVDRMMGRPDAGDRNAGAAFDIAQARKPRVTS
jgi:hypothetical protein